MGATLTSMTIHPCCIYHVAALYLACVRASRSSSRPGPPARRGYPALLAPCPSFVASVAVRRAPTVLVPLAVPLLLRLDRHLPVQEEAQADDEHARNDPQYPPLDALLALHPAHFPLARVHVPLHPFRRHPRAHDLFPPVVQRLEDLVPDVRGVGSHLVRGVETLGVLFALGHPLDQGFALLAGNLDICRLLSVPDT